MVRNKNLIIVFVAYVLILLGILFSPNNISTKNDTSSPLTFEEVDNFNISHNITELRANNNEKELELIGFGNNLNEVYTSFYDSDDDNYKYAIKNLKTNKDFVLYESKNAFAIAISGVYMDKLYIVETLIEDNKFISYIVLVNKEGKVSRYKIGIMDKIPYVQQADNLVLINFEHRLEDKVNSYLAYFDMANNQLENI